MIGLRACNFTGKAVATLLRRGRVRSLCGLRSSRALLSESHVTPTQIVSEEEIELYRYSRSNSIRSVLAYCSASWIMSEFQSFPEMFEAMPQVQLTAYSVAVLTTALAIVFLRSYSSRSVYRCCVSPDKKTMELQVHTIFGNPGRKYEVDASKMRFVDKEHENYAWSIVNGEKGIQRLEHSIKSLSSAFICDDQDNSVKFALSASGLHQHNHELVSLLSKNSATGAEGRDIVFRSQHLWKRRRMP